MKSNVSDCLEQVECIYRDASTKCTADVFDLRDLRTIRSRVETEGLSFLTITLPEFCKDLERGLESGFIDSTSFRNFKLLKGGSHPAFLQGMTSQVFDVKTGELYNENNCPHLELLRDIPTIIEGIRQICLAFKKVSLPCSERRLRKAEDNYLNVEAQLSTFITSEEDTEEFLSVSDLIWGNILSGLSPVECVPRHGPGATAEGISGNRKYRWREWYSRLDTYFPLIGSAYPIGLELQTEEYEEVQIVPPEDEMPVRVISVPKTLKGPRIIAIEPVCMQYAQQGIRDLLYKTIESHPLTAGHLNFSDQSINRSIALKSSESREFATLDLSDASDRVPLILALQMFRTNPDLQDAVLSCRSTKAKLRSGQIIDPLYKFASMGSALCFPVEAMYFYTICVIALLKAEGLSLSFRNVNHVSKSIYIYGDDIIIPRVNAVVVSEYLHKYNCKVNSNKSFVTGKFRESCGMDAYSGYEVTPTYFRVLRPRHKRQVSSILSWSATANLFYKRGYWRTANLMFNQLEKILGNFPYVSEESSGIGRISFLGYRSIERWNDNLHRFEIEAYVPRPIYRTDKLEGYGALMKCLLILEGKYSDMEVKKDHLERTALYGGVALIRRWVTAY